MQNENDWTKPLLVAVMGATGTGKSTFINKASDGNLAVSDMLNSCTSEVLLSDEFEIDGRKIIIVDTPGFDDTNKSDMDILTMIASHLNTSYQAGITLSGILFLHRISDIRMGGISRRNFKMFRKLCGEESLKNVLIVTTMWDSVTPQVGDLREAQLKSDERFFKPVLDKGAGMVRHDNTRETAQAILHLIINNHPLPLRIQKEMVDEKKGIDETAAADELNRVIAELVEKHKKEIEKVKKELQEAMEDRDEVSQRELQEVKDQMENELKRHEFDRKQLAEGYAAEKKRSEEAMKQFMNELQQQRISRAEADKRMSELQQSLQKARDDAHEKERLLLLKQIEELNRPPPPICLIQ